MSGASRLATAYSEERSRWVKAKVREHLSLGSSSPQQGALTEMLIDKIIIAPHPHKIVDGRRRYTIRAIPYQDPQQEAERLKAVHEARVKIVPRV
jgi:hypothetical protein